MTHSGLPWQRIFGLHVLRNLEAVARAQAMAVGYVDAATGDGRAAHAHAGCPHGGGDRCAEPLLRALQDDDGEEVSIVVAHPGVRELLAPVVVRGHATGALTLGPLPGGDGAVGAHARSVLASLLQAAAWDVADFASTAPRPAPAPPAPAPPAPAPPAPDAPAPPRPVRSAPAAPGPAPAPRDRFGAILGGAPAMVELYALLDKVSRADSTVLVQGENGTGKELVARAIHAGSPRRDRPFVVVNCSAFNDNLLDSELFGHVRGAFTGAVVDKPGLFEQADTGTFFLDELGDMSPALQVKVLRVLQEGTFTRVGDIETRTVDVRVIAATHRDLRAMVGRGEFREDLYYRVNVINLVLPALRQRRDDLPLLVEHFLERRAGDGRRKRLTEGCVERLRAYPWPGNVRELENEIERLVVLAGDGPEIAEALLSPRIRQYAEPAPDPTALDPYSLPLAVEALERRMIGDALQRHGGNKSRAAAELRVSRRNLIRLVRRYGL